MSDTAIARLKAEGWTILDDDGFINLVGPLWRRMNGADPEYAIVGQEKHRNRRGVVQGGLLMTLADRTCGMTARFVSGTENTATVQMDTQFVDAARIGDIMISRPRVVRDTKSLIFMKTEVTVEGRCVVAASGVFKKVRKEVGPAPSAERRHTARDVPG
jgi:acyl-coenzyme A thioesterase PaaI-like protein